jgi:hypothetical protein
MKTAEAKLGCQVVRELSSEGTDCRAGGNCNGKFNLAPFWRAATKSRQLEKVFTVISGLAVFCTQVFFSPFRVSQQVSR